MAKATCTEHPFVVATVLDPQLKRMNDAPPAVCEAAYRHVCGLTDAAAHKLSDSQHSSEQAVSDAEAKTQALAAFTPVNIGHRWP